MAGMVHPIPGGGIARTYLITDEKDGLMVVDCGSVGAARAVEAFCARTVRRSLTAVRVIAATHFHIDHIGGIGTLLRICPPETAVLFHPLVKAYLKAGRPLLPMRNWVTGLLPTLLAGALVGVRRWSDLAFDGPSGLPLSFLQDLQRVSYGDRIRYPEGDCLPKCRIGFGDWEIIAVPGHTEESVAFYNEASGELIAGDLILGGKNGRGYLNRFAWDEGQARRSFAALSESIRVRIVFPGHGPVFWAADDAFCKVDGFRDVPADDAHNRCLRRIQRGSGSRGSRQNDQGRSKE